MPHSSLFRSEEMSLIQLYIPQETAPYTVAELGELGLIQFRDLNPDVNAFQRAYVKEIRRLDEMERHLRFFAAQMAKSDIEIIGDATGARAKSATEIDELEEKIKEHERHITQMNDSYEKLQKRYLELTEARHVLQETAEFFEEAVSRQDDIRNSFDEPTAPLLEHQDLEQGEPIAFSNLNLGFVAGVISRAKMQTFERILWRALRGNLYLNYAEIDEPITDPETDEVLEKNVFIIFAHGRELINKIRKISESLGATLYKVDDNPDQRKKSLKEITDQIEDHNSVLLNTKNARRSELIKIAEDLSIWMTIVKKEKAIYHNMNLFIYDSNRKCLIAEGWCPTNDLDQIKQTLKAATDMLGSTVPSILNELATTKEPPTFHRTNKFTVGFQEIVDAYGVARYREVNPGLFTVITFPFLFAVMFGDCGHGVLILEMFFGGRYIILLMGLFSIYTGLIYNDMFSRTLKLFPSGFVWPLNQTGVIEARQAWHGTDNYLLFTNSYKMKMSIILGVIQMSFGIILTIYNYTYFKKTISIYAEFIPQMLFMQSIFGYLVFTIIYKWSIDWYEKDTEGNALRNSPPGLLNMLIYMFLQPGTVSETTLLIIALICIPWMLFVKPFILRQEYKKIRTQGYHNPQTDATRISTDEDNEYGGAVVAEEMLEIEEFDFGEIIVHQVIHTIEFCLGCISNTASYLRLWALSLAHAQLSVVLWDMTLKPTLHMKGVFGIIAFIIALTLWFCLTIGILLLMEGLSAFLHALRLHWVEFNGKFYEGTGRKFEPFSFEILLKREE
ncbi:1443_t:CDS:10 [Diversispora eburnea]|uniref:V-type proton ATPase subunit a n=1 Tax=Diversispora eburnea TaxID=1213867 RepID=A0A9N8V2V9_9GLOM|nr:1443_t:CDS:10 [Diversispora eburnea]